MFKINSDDIKKFSIQSIYAVENGKEVFLYGDVQNLYSQHSISKVFTSTAIGLLADKSLIRLDDKISKYLNFKNDADPEIYKVTVRDLLTQTMGTHIGFLFHDERMTVKEDFVDYIARQPIERKVSKYFEYNDATFYLLSRIIENISKMPLDVFLKDNLLSYLNIYTEQDELCFSGHPLGCSGFKTSTKDIVKLGLFYLNNGFFNGQQLLSEDYIKKATTKHMRVNSRDKYGLGWWVRKDFYYCTGAKGQLLLIIPHTKTVIGINSTDEIGKNKDFVETIFSYLTF